MRIIAAVVLAIGVLGVLAATSRSATAPSPRVIAVVPTALGLRLQPLDARTLAPVRRGWSLAVGRDAPVVVSPSGSRVAVAVGPSDLGGTNGSVLVLDTRTGRVQSRDRNEDASQGLYWLGTDDLPLLVGVGFDCSSPGGCGEEYTVVGSQSGFAVDIDGDPTTALKEGLVFAFEPTSLNVYDGDYFGIELPRMPPAVPFEVVADVVHDRLFDVSASGMVAEIDNVGLRPHITYHTVGLNGRPFSAAWAGSGRIALWGQDGLGTIDTRTWTTHSIAQGVTGLVTTRFGMAAWTNNPADGLTVYRPDGRPRLHLLVGKKILSAQAVGAYLYVDANVRYSVDLRTGRVTGPLAKNVRIIAPTLTLIP